mmetsp:Transcript_45723/g.111320  ORF Transcript_45723/g.111320 Transcript_45723/m.111320 type:complete len:80 (+) Transcript_45723:846-1085(+)
MRARGCDCKALCEELCDGVTASRRLSATLLRLVCKELYFGMRVEELLSSRRAHGWAKKAGERAAACLMTFLVFSDVFIV